MRNGKNRFFLFTQMLLSVFEDAGKRARDALAASDRVHRRSSVLRFARSVLYLRLVLLRKL